MRKLVEFIDKFLNYMCILFMTLMTLIVIVEVFLRYVFGKGFIWSEEVVSMLFVATTLFGTVIGVKQNEHITIPFFLEKMPYSVQNICKMVSSFISVAIQIVIVTVSVQWIGKVGNVLSPVIRVPLQYFYFMLPLSAGLLILYELRNVKKHACEALKCFKGNEQGSGIEGGGL